MRWIERIINELFENVVQAGERAYRIRALSLALHAIRALRYAARSIFFAASGLIVFTASVFAALIHTLEQTRPKFDAFNGFAFVVGAASLAFTIHFLREKTWLDAFEIPKYLKMLNSPSRASQGRSEQQIDEAIRVALMQVLADEEKRAAAAKTEGYSSSPSSSEGSTVPSAMVSTISLSSLPTLKNGTRLGGT